MVIHILNFQTNKGNVLDFINKNNINSYSSTSIHNLNKEGRIEEIARMLSGEKITEAARNAAESLFNHNKNVL